MRTRSRRNGGRGGSRGGGDRRPEPPTAPGLGGNTPTPTRTKVSYIDFLNVFSPTPLSSPRQHKRPRVAAQAPINLDDTLTTVEEAGQEVVSAGGKDMILEAILETVAFSMEEAEEDEQEIVSAGGMNMILEAVACSMEKGKEKEEDVEVIFDGVELDEQLKRALRKKGISKATPIQREAIPLILEGKDVVANAKTGSGKTFAYLLPLLQELLKLSSKGRIQKPTPNAFILVPTRELCQQVYNEVLSLLEFCTCKLRIVQVTTSMSDKDITVAVSAGPNILVSTPACVATCISKGIIHGPSVKKSLSMMILDEADLLLSYRCEDDLKALIPYIPKSCQSILMSANSSSDVDKLTKLLLHNPSIINLSEVGQAKDDVTPKNVQQFWAQDGARSVITHDIQEAHRQDKKNEILNFENHEDDESNSLEDENRCEDELLVGQLGANNQLQEDEVNLFQKVDPNWVKHMLGRCKKGTTGKKEDLRKRANKEIKLEELTRQHLWEICKANEVSYNIRLPKRELIERLKTYC